MTEYKPEEIISAAYKVAKAIIENEIEDMYKDTYYFRKGVASETRFPGGEGTFRGPREKDGSSKLI